MQNIIAEKYKIITVLGSGGMSEVYLAQDTRTGKKVAIKILDKKLSRDEEYIKRFKREIEISKALSHPNIVNIISYGKDKDSYYIVYEYIDGLTLDNYLKSKKLSIKEIKDITLQILQGLSYAHSKKIIHRDIKPSNIMVSKGKVKILDFGIARATTRSTITKTGMFMGSPHYISPEQADSKKLDYRTDIYSFGVVLYEMLTGKVPFDANTPWGIVYKHIHEKPKDITRISLKTPHYLSEVVNRCLAKNPSDRFSSAEEVIRDIKSKHPEDQTIIRPIKPESINQKARLSGAKVAGIAIGSLAAVAIAVISTIFGINYANQRNSEQIIAEEEAIAAEVAEEAPPLPETLKLNQDLNIIISGAGQDLMEPEVNSIIFTSYYSTTIETRSLCLPVKTLMDVPGIGAELIGRSVELGGMDLLALTLEKGLGMDIKIDYYLLMDVANIVDRLGGIELELDQAYVVSDYTNASKFSMEPGTNLIDGLETFNILKYFSGIEKDIQLKHLKMQKKVIDAIITRIAGENSEELTNNLNQVKDFIDSDLSLEELLKLFSTFSSISTENNLVFTIGASSTELEGEGIVYLPDVAGLSKIFSKEQAIAEEEPVAEQTVDVIILNGVGTPGIGDEISNILMGQLYESGKNKFNVLEVGNADNFNYAYTELLVYSSDESVVMKAANDLKEMLAVGNITTSQEKIVDSDIVIILGADYNPGNAAGTEPAEVSEKIFKDITYNEINGTIFSDFGVVLLKYNENTVNVWWYTIISNAPSNSRIVIKLYKDGLLLDERIHNNENDNDVSISEEILYSGPGKYGFELFFNGVLALSAEKEDIRSYN